MQNTSNPDLELSIIIPVYNERDNLVPLEKKLEEELAKLHLDYEIIFVDDGSVDGSPHIIKSLRKYNPKVLLLDEPFANVDLLSIQDVKSLLLNLQSRGCGILVTDHNASQLLSIVDRGYVIANGTIIASGTPRQIVGSSAAREKYFGKDFTL